jgi:glycogen operon protein
VTVSVSRLERGRPGPFGARVDGDGVNFAVFSEHAEAVELCLYDARGERETARLALHRSGDVWHGRLPGAGAGLVYGLRAHGLWRPDEGHRFNAHKLLLDPYAREIVGRYEWRAEHFAGDAEGRLDTRDNAAYALKARVVADTFDWGDDRAPRTPLADTLLYELHVKGFTRLHPSVPEALRGTYAGLASDAAIAHLRRLGVSAVACCRCNNTSTSSASSRRASPTTGATTRSATSRPSRATRATARPPRRAPISARWSGGCMPRASR